jgi:RNA polymerase sigma-70 factor (ECF subfamily)
VSIDWSELYRTTFPDLVRFLHRKVWDPDQARDLAQEAFVRAWQKLPSFRGASAFTTWMHRVAVNVVLGHFRTAGRRLDDVATDDELSAAGLTQAPDSGLTLDLDRAISTLPHGARTVLVLHDIEGYTHDEIARMSGVAVGTSKAQLSRARRLLRKVLSS